MVEEWGGAVNGPGYVLLNDWMGFALSEEAVKALADARASNGNSVVAVPIKAAIASAELLDLAKEFQSYLELKLTGFRQDYPEDHCMVQTAVRYLDQARAVIAKAEVGR